MYINSVLTPAVIGKRRRLYRLLGETGRCIIVPLDDNLISQDNVGLKYLQDKVHDIESAKPSGILCYYGTASLISSLNLPLIINISASTVHSHHTNKVLISSVKQAVAIDAVAVAVHVNLSSEFESSMLENLGKVSELCNQYGMPLLVIIYPRREVAGTDDNYKDLQANNIVEYTKLVSHCVRVAFEMGADLIKTQYTGDSASFSEVVTAACGKPVLIAGGTLCSEDSLYDTIRGSINAGGAGVSIGRNIFNRPNSSEIIKNINHIVFG